MPSRSPAEEQALRKKLVDFYKQYSPGELFRVETALKADIAEETLFAGLHRKYNVGSDTLRDTAVPGEESKAESIGRTAENSGLRQRLTAFYMRHNPTEMHRVDVAMGLKVSEEELFANLYKRYKLGPNGDPIAPAEGTTPMSSQHSGTPSGSTGNSSHEKAGLRQRLTAFYERHSPSDMFKIDAALKLDISEEELFRRLYKKYNLDANGEEKKKEDVGYRQQSQPETIEPSSAQQATDKKIVPLMTSQNSTKLHTKTLIPDLGRASKEIVRKRLVNFYMTHNPAEISKVDGAMKMALTEEELFGKLHLKYNVVDDIQYADPSNADREECGSVQVAPPVQTSHEAHSSPTTGDNSNSHIEPKTVAADAKVDLHVNERAGGERNSSTNPEPQDHDLLQAQPCHQRSDLECRLIAFYERYSPSEVEEKVKYALSLLQKLTEEELFQRLYKKYNIGADGEPKPVVVKHGARAASPEQHVTEQPASLATNAEVALSSDNVKGSETSTRPPLEVRYVDDVHDETAVPVSTVPTNQGIEDVKNNLIAQDESEMVSASAPVDVVSDTSSSSMSSSAASDDDHVLTEQEVMAYLEEESGSITGQGKEDRDDRNFVSTNVNPQVFSKRTDTTQEVKSSVGSSGGRFLTPLVDSPVTTSVTALPVVDDTDVRSGLSLVRSVNAEQNTTTLSTTNLKTSSIHAYEEDTYTAAIPTPPPHLKVITMYCVIQNLSIDILRRCPDSAKEKAHQCLLDDIQGFFRTYDHRIRYVAAEEVSVLALLNMVDNRLGIFSVHVHVGVTSSAAAAAITLRLQRSNNSVTFPIPRLRLFYVEMGGRPMDVPHGVLSEFGGLSSSGDDDQTDEGPVAYNEETHHLRVTHVEERTVLDTGSAASPQGVSSANPQPSSSAPTKTVEGSVSPNAPQPPHVQPHPQDSSFRMPANPLRLSDVDNSANLRIKELETSLEAAFDELEDQGRVIDNQNVELDRARKEIARLQDEALENNNAEKLQAAHELDHLLQERHKELSASTAVLDKREEELNKFSLLLEAKEVELVERERKILVAQRKGSTRPPWHTDDQQEGLSKPSTQNVELSSRLQAISKREEELKRLDDELIKKQSIIDSRLQASSHQVTVASNSASVEFNDAMTEYVGVLETKLAAAEQRMADLSAKLSTVEEAKVKLQSSPLKVSQTELDRQDDLRSHNLKKRRDVALSSGTLQMANSTPLKVGHPGGIFGSTSPGVTSVERKTGKKRVIHPHHFLAANASIFPDSPIPTSEIRRSAVNSDISVEHAANRVKAAAKEVSVAFDLEKNVPDVSPKVISNVSGTDDSAVTPIRTVNRGDMDDGPPAVTSTPPSLRKGESDVADMLRRVKEREMHLRRAVEQHHIERAMQGAISQ